MHMHDILQMWLNIQKTQSLVASIGRGDKKPIIFWIHRVTGFINEGGARKGKGQGRGGVGVVLGIQPAGQGSTDF